MHTILLALRAGAFFAWLGCWCVWLSCRAKLPAALTPLAAMCGSSLVIYAAALLNVIWPVQLALYLAGPVLAVGCVIREKWKALRPFVCISAVLFLAAAGATLLLERGRVIDEHDELAHWAIAAKTILNNGRLPNMGDLAVEYVDYPPAAALWIKLVCNLTGFSDGSMVFAQSLLFLAAILAFAPLCKKRWYAGAAVLGYAVYMACASIAYRELRVDGMLTVLTVAAWAATAALRREPKRALAAVLPVLCFLAILKNSGMFFVVLGGIPLVVLLVRDGHKRSLKAAGLAALPLAAPALTWWLWQVHVKQVFVNGESSKHAASLTAYAERLGDKTPESIAEFWKEFAGFWMSALDPAVLRLYAFSAAFLLVCVLLAVLKAVRWRAAAGFAAAWAAATAVYVAALAGTYLFSMSAEEMVVLASIGRYAASYFECLPAAAIILVLVNLEPALEEPGRLHGLLPAGARQWQAFVLCAVLTVFSAGFAAAYGDASNLWRSARAVSADARQNYWLDLKAQYGLPDRASYLLYTNANQVDTWSERYVARYALNTNNLLFVQGDELLTAAKALEYDFIVFCAPDEVSDAFLECLDLSPDTPYVELSPYRGKLLRMEWDESVAVKEFTQETWPSVWDKVRLADDET